MYSLNWHRSFDVCKLVDALGVNGALGLFISLWLHRPLRGKVLRLVGRPYVIYRPRRDIAAGPPNIIAKLAKPDSQCTNYKAHRRDFTATASVPHRQTDAAAHRDYKLHTTMTKGAAVIRNSWDWQVYQTFFHQHWCTSALTRC